MDKILIDTDVILDFFFDRKPFSEHATEILSFCELNMIKGFITPVILSNVYYILRQTAKHEKVVEKIKQLLTITKVLIIDKEVLIQALNSKFKDFEDAIQNYAAVKSGAVDTIITRNIKDYKYSDIGVLTPEQYVKIKIAGHQ